MSTSNPKTTEGSRYRSDIEGLRAVAVLLVLAYHAGIPVFGGGFVGVDVFFVVSGFVITSQLLREVESSGTVDLLRFYGRRAKRLLPAAALVLVVTALAAWLLAPRTQWSAISTDLVGASLYVVNWVFVGRSVDYLAEDVDPSPVLHFWSLAIEEQFYLIWPLLILALVWAAAHRRSSGVGVAAHRRASRDGVSRRWLAFGLTAVMVIPSLAWSIYYTATDPQPAFFATTARLWELGLGALVALGGRWWLRWPSPVGCAVAWSGLGAVLLSGMFLSSQTPWPGAAALAPTLGAAAIVAGGFTSGHRGPQMVLGWRGAVWIGGLSYSLYLWHWPMLRMAEWQWGEVSLIAGVAVVVASVIPAWLSFRFVEHPIRSSSMLNRTPKIALLVGANLTLVSLVAALVLSDASYRAASPTAASGGSVAGDVVAGDVAKVDAAPSKATDPPLYETLTPDPLKAVDDVPDLYSTGCQVGETEDAVTSCPAGDPDGDTVVYVIGDSKIGQWMPAIEEIGRANGWQIVLHTKSTCAFTGVTTAVRDEPYEQCRDWGRAVMKEVQTAGPDAVIVGSLRDVAYAEDGSVTSEAMVDGYVDYWRQLIDQGIPVIALSDNPSPGIAPVYECVDEHRENPLDYCTWPAKDGKGSPAMRKAAERVNGAEYLDMNPWVCPDGTCTGVWRNIVTYRQGSHLTKTFVLALATSLAAQLVPLVEADAD